MSGDFPFPATKTVSPLKCNEKPWDLWISEIGYRSPRREDEAKGERGRRRRAGLNRLRPDTMSLHGLLPQMDTLDAAVCHLCGAVVKVSAAHRHLLDAHSAAAEPRPPPPPPAAPAAKLKAPPARVRPRRDPPPAPPDPVPAPAPAPAPPPALPALPALPVLPAAAPDLHYLQDVAVAPDVQVSVDTGDLPVVSIQDTEDLPLGENITDDIIAIMNSEGIRREDDIVNAPDWKNIIRDLDIGNMQEINFPAVADPVQNPELYVPVDPPISGYAIPEADLALQFAAAAASPAQPVAVDVNVLNPQALIKPATPSTKTSSRKPSKTKFNLREYDPNKHCGVVTADNQKPCTRSLTCKAHALSLRRAVEGRAKPFDTLLAEHRAAREAAQLPHPPAAATAAASLPTLSAAATTAAAPLDLGALNGLADDDRVDHIYASLLADEDPDSVLPDTSSITSLLSQPGAEEAATTATVDAEAESEPADGGVFWYAACPRPLALCTFNAMQVGGAVTLGRRFAMVRSSVKTSLARGGKAGGAACGAARAARAARPELRRLVAALRPGGACGAAGAAAAGAAAARDAALSELFGEARLNGHAPVRSRLKPPAAAPLDLPFALDPLLADEKC